MRDVQWNTGAKYTAEGQVIRAVEQAGGSILFADFSRMIYGAIEAPCFPVQSDARFQEYVQAKYLRGHYEMSCEAMSLERKEAA